MKEEREGGREAHSNTCISFPPFSLFPLFLSPCLLGPSISLPPFLPPSLPPFIPPRYVRVLGALYLRLVGTSLEVYNYLEPLYNDYRKLKMMNRNGEFELTHVDEFVDVLLREERVCDVILPRIQVLL